MNTLIERIEEGMTTDADARRVERMIERLYAYELALRRIAVHGTGRPAMLAARTLAQPSSAYFPLGEFHGCDES